MKIVILTSHDNRGKDGIDWEPGDQMITEGVYRLLPELNKHEVVLIKAFKPEDQDEVIKNCDYVIQAGTPGWIHPSFRKNWESCAAHKKHIAFLGIGLAVPYEADFWYGREAFQTLVDTQLIDLIVCRDKYALYWIHKRMGFNSARIWSLPCPAFYMMDEDPSTTKKKVVFSVANIEETSHAGIDAFKEYYANCRYIVKELEKSGAEVFVNYMRFHAHRPAFITEMQELFDRTIYGFKSPAEFRAHHRDKSIYIGVRNHGALPMSGAGKPSLLLGTDYRQKLAEEIPFLSKFDISYTGLNPREILDWYHALEPQNVSMSLLNYRRLTYQRWRRYLAPILEVLK